MEEHPIYDDLDSLVSLYRIGELPTDRQAFPYRKPNGLVTWAHIDEIKKLAVVTSAYPGSNTKKHQK